MLFLFSSVLVNQLCLVYILSSYYEYLDWNRVTFLVMLLFIVYRLLKCGVRECCVS